jgi:hypothetical protein
MNTGVKYDKEKSRWDLVLLYVLEGFVRVLTFGAKKYADNNWMIVENAEQRYFSALMRHITAYQAGETVDKESNESHLSHALCCIYFLLYFELKRNNKKSA